jgi:hypothetical protein
VPPVRAALTTLRIMVSRFDGAASTITSHNPVAIAWQPSVTTGGPVANQAARSVHRNAPSGVKWTMPSSSSSVRPRSSHPDDANVVACNVTVDVAAGSMGPGQS